MKTIKFAAILMVLVCSVHATFAQTDLEKKLAELKAREAVATYINETDLNSKELKANTAETPCALYDDETWYTAYNQKGGRPGDPQLANSLLRTCQQQLKDKLAGKVQAITTAYFDQMDIDGRSSAAEHIEGASQTAVDQSINETQEYCRRQSLPDENGNIIMYMSIRIKKQEILQVMEEGIAKDKEAKVRYNEKQFREAAFKVFEEDKSQQ